MQPLQLAVVVAFVLLAVLSVRLWWRHRSPQTTWLAWTFGSLAVGVAAGQLATALPAVASGVRWMGRIAVVAFPYLLFRFVASFQPSHRRLRQVAGVLAGAVIATTVFVPPPSPGDRPSWYALYVLGVLVMWTALSAWVVWRLWRSGHEQPTVARHRLRTLALAAAVLNAALILAGISATASEAILTRVIRGTALASAALFYTGFAPPPIVRQVWRRSDERALWRAEGELMAATTGREVVSSMLPHISRLLGGGPVLFIDEDGANLTHGEVTDSMRAQLSGQTFTSGEVTVADDIVALGLRGGRLGVGITAATPLFGSDEIELLGWLGTLMDLAWARSELYDREQQARARAEALAGELESLVYGLSHDLRRPIVSVIGYADCLSEDYGALLEGEGLHFLARLRANVEHMDRLVGDLLALSRVGRIDEDPEPVALTAVVGQVAEELARQFPNATIEVAALPVVRMDPARARQLFANLVANALIHGGRPDVTVRVAPAADGAAIAVTDDGRGIAEHQREQAFALFERLGAGGDDSRGSGIGLAMCRRIVEHAGGTIWIADSDHGTDVRVQLPTASEAAGDTQETG